MLISLERFLDVCIELQNVCIDLQNILFCLENKIRFDKTFL